MKFINNNRNNNNNTQKHNVNVRDTKIIWPINLMKEHVVASMKHKVDTLQTKILNLA